MIHRLPTCQYQHHCLQKCCCRMVFHTILYNQWREYLLMFWRLLNQNAKFHEYMVACSFGLPLISFAASEDNCSVSYAIQRTFRCDHCNSLLSGSFQRKQIQFSPLYIKKKILQLLLGIIWFWLLLFFPNRN